MSDAFKIALYIMLSFSVIGFILLGVDKYNARHSLYRISEATLFFFGILGGAMAMFLGMKLFRHKTKKPKFMLFFPIFSAIHIIVLLLLL